MSALLEYMQQLIYTDIAIYQKFYIVLKHFMHVSSIPNMHSITVITVFLLKCSTQKYSINLERSIFIIYLFIYLKLYSCKKCTSV